MIKQLQSGLPVFCMILLSGCLSASVTRTGGGGGQDASSCISITNPDSAESKATITNSCNVAVNFVEFSTGSLGLMTIAPMSVIEQGETIFAWGACVSPAVPERVMEFDFRCRN